MDYVKAICLALACATYSNAVNLDKADKILFSDEKTQTEDEKSKDNKTKTPVTPKNSIDKMLKKKSDMESREKILNSKKKKRSLFYYLCCCCWCPAMRSE